MTDCPICRHTAATGPPDWAGGRMLVECGRCGQYEIGPKLFEELASLAESNWQIELLKQEIAKVPEPRVVRRRSTNIVHVEAPGADKPTKLQKRTLRARAEEKTVSGGAIVYTGDRKSEDDT